MDKQAASLTAKPRAKRNRQFIVESRALPSRLASIMGDGPGPWTEGHSCALLNAARAIVDSEGYPPTMWKPGAEYRVRRTDLKVPA